MPGIRLAPLVVLSACAGAVTPATVAPTAPVVTAATPGYHIAAAPRSMELPEPGPTIEPGRVDSPFLFLPEEEPAIHREIREAPYWEAMWQLDRSEMMRALPPGQSALADAQLDELAAAPRTLYQGGDGVCRRWTLRVAPVPDPRTGARAYRLRWSRTGAPYRARDGALRRVRLREEVVVHQSMLTGEPDMGGAIETWDEARGRWEPYLSTGGVGCFVPQALTRDRAGTIRVGGYARLYATAAACRRDLAVTAADDRAAIPTLIWTPPRPCIERIITRI
jgi:hypothetical protein